MPQARTALYAGSFDPVTSGHLDVMRQALRLCDHLVVAIGVHPGKAPLFTAEERAAMIEAEGASLAAEAGSRLTTTTFDGLVVAAAARHEASLLIRGLRDGSDLDDEMRMAGMNGAMAPGLQTVLLPASPPMRPITATLVRQIAAMGGDVTAFVPTRVALRLAQRFHRPI